MQPGRASYPPGRRGAGGVDTCPRAGQSLRAGSAASRRAGRRAPFVAQSTSAVLAGTPADVIGPGLDGDAMGDLTQPAAETLLAPDRPTLADEDQEGGLKGVLDVVGAAEDRAADAQYHRPVPLDQGREGRFIPPREEPIQELAVGETGHRPLDEQAVDLSQRAADRRTRHGQCPPRRSPGAFPPLRGLTGPDNQDSPGRSESTPEIPVRPCRVRVDDRVCRILVNRFAGNCVFPWPHLAVVPRSLGGVRSR